MERIIKYFPAFGAVLVFSGVVRLVTYYWYFNLNIINFITFSEILTSFLDSLIYFLLLFFVVSLYFYLHFTTNGKIDISEIKDTSENNVVINPKNKSLNLVLVIFLFIIAIVYIYRTSINWYYFQIPLLIITVPAFIVMVLMVFFVIQVKSNDEKEIGFMTIGCLFILIISSASFMAAVRQEHSPKEEVIFTFKDKDYSTNDSIVYLGKTENFLFLHNKKENKNVIFKMEHIDKMEIRVKSKKEQKKTKENKEKVKSVATDIVKLNK